MDWTKVLIPCSSLGKIMTQPRGRITDKQLEKLAELSQKERFSVREREEYFRLLSMRETSPPELSQTCKNFLHEFYAFKKYGRRFAVADPISFAMKGIAVESRGIAMVSKMDGMKYFKNRSTFRDGFISGRPDVNDPEKVIDIKASWDLRSFYVDAGAEELDKKYWWQMQGYFALTGKEAGEVVFCLITTPNILIQAQQKRLYEELNQPGEKDPRYLAAKKRLESSMRFDDISENERVFRVVVERDEKAIQRIYPKVQQCREYLLEIERYHQKNTDANKEIHSSYHTADPC